MPDYCCPQKMAGRAVGGKILVVSPLPRVVRPVKDVEMDGGYASQAVR